MLHDYMMYRGDKDFISSKLPVVRLILEYFKGKERPDATLYPLDYHQFVDWSFPAGEAPAGVDGRSSVADLHYLMALQWSAELEEWAGDPGIAEGQRLKAGNLSRSIKQLYWNEDLGLFVDHVGNVPVLSQHANSLAILTGVANDDTAASIMKKILLGDNMTHATLYWSFYVMEALQACGLGDQYLDSLDVWTQVMDLGVTTWPESGPNSRSECHGWGASPNFHFLKITAGIQPSSPGFNDVLVQPHFGDLNRIQANMPHPKGMITLDLKRTQGTVSGWIQLPEGINGTFSWNGTGLELSPGRNEID